MKIYLLRHEDRTMDLTFFSPLTEAGLENSVNLTNILEKEKINLIYSSPYIRTLQTIYPYAKKYNIKMNLDYSLGEIYDNEYIPKKSYQITLPEYIAKGFNYNEDYKSQIYPTDINYPEKNCDFIKRIKTFLKTIILQNHKSDKNIVLVTHKGNINIIINIIKKKLKIKDDRVNSSQIGELLLIMENNNWVLNNIN